MVSYTEIDTVWHVGTLELGDRTDQSSLEGNLLSVSEHPEEWGMIARCGGETWELSREGAKWLDALELADDEIETIQQWAIEQGLAIAAPVWRVWHFDGEADSWGYFEFDSEAEALAQVDEDLEPELYDIPSDTGEQLEKRNDIILTEAGRDAVGRWSSNTNAQDALIILWAERVLSPEEPDLMGVWWYEDDNPASLSCPRGGAFTARLGEFDIESDRGAEPPSSFLQTHFPDESEIPCPCA